MTATQRAAAVLLAAMAFALSPVVVGGFGGFSGGRFPVPQVDPPVQPAGWAFSIWIVIYTWLVVHAAFGVFRRRRAEDWDRGRPWLFAALAVGAIWIPVAQQGPVGATVLIVVMLAAALRALDAAPTRDVRWAQAPLGLFAGWLTAATCVSLGLLAAGYGLVSEVVAAWGAIALAAGIAVWVLSRRAAVSYALAVGWGLMGIAATNFGSQTGLAALSLSLAAAIVAYALWLHHASA